VDEADDVIDEVERVEERLVDFWRKKNKRRGEERRGEEHQGSRRERGWGSTRKHLRRECMFCLICSCESVVRTIQETCKSWRI
jgi:hypothetical protein